MSPEQLAEALAKSRREQRALEELLACAREREPEQGSEIAELRQGPVKAPPGGGKQAGRATDLTGAPEASQGGARGHWPPPGEGFCWHPR